MDGNCNILCGDCASDHKDGENQVRRWRESTPVRYVPGRQRNRPLVCHPHPAKPSRNKVRDRNFNNCLLHNSLHKGKEK